MAKAEMCSQSASSEIWTPLKKWDAKKKAFVKVSLKPKRMRCLTCGRRIMVSPQVSSDGDGASWVLPPHKVKEWYKKKEKKHETRSYNARHRAGVR